MVVYLVAYDIGGYTKYLRHIINLFLIKRFTSQMLLQ